MSKDSKDLKEGEVVNPDGSIFRFEGEEPLKKPKTKKTLKDRWKILKADLYNSKAFLNMLGEDQDETEEKPGTEPGEGPVQNADNAVGSTVPVGSEQAPTDSKPDVAAGGQMQDKDQGVDGSVGEELNSQLGGQQADTASQQEQEQGQEQDQEQDQGQEEQPYSEEQIIQLLKEEGYSDSEIAYVVHHQVPAQPTKEELKHAETTLDLKHKSSKQDQELNHKDAHHSVDVEHKKRMTDLEFEHDKKEKEMRLKFLEQELQAKVEALKNKSKEQ